MLKIGNIYLRKHFSSHASSCSGICIAMKSSRNFKILRHVLYKNVKSWNYDSCDNIPYCLCTTHCGM